MLQKIARPVLNSSTKPRFIGTKARKGVMKRMLVTPNAVAFHAPTALRISAVDKLSPWMKKMRHTQRVDIIAQPPDSTLATALPSTGAVSPIKAAKPNKRTSMFFRHQALNDFQY